VKQRFRIRSVSFVGEREYPQGVGMTYDDLDLVVDLEDGEEIIQVERGWQVGRGFDSQVPVVTVWIKTLFEEAAT